MFYIVLEGAYWGNKFGFANKKKTCSECIYTKYIYCANERSTRVFRLSYDYPMVILWLSYGAGCCIKVEYKHAAIRLRACEGTITLLLDRCE